MSDEMKECPQCESPYGYASGDKEYTCPECQHIWQPKEEGADSEREAVSDANGNELESGDSVIIVKDLPVKGAPGPLKAGTKVKKIRLQEGDHNISCNIPGFGAMALKSEFVKKA